MFQSSVLTPLARSILILSDIAVLVFAVWCALFVRFLAVPSTSFFVDHLVAFIPVGLIALIALFVSGLYEDDLFLLKQKRMYRIVLATIATAFFAVLLFYSYPYAGITPKSILLLFIIFLFGLLIVVRTFFTAMLGRTQEKSAVLIATAPESDDVYVHVNKHTHIPFTFTDLVPLETALFFLRTQKTSPDYIVVHTKKSLGEELQEVLYAFVMRGGKIIDQGRLYESLFHKVELSDANYRAFFEPVSASRKIFLLWKRCTDILVSLCLIPVALPLIAIAAIAIKMHDGKEIFISQTRIGKFGRRMTMYKMRTMAKSDAGKWLKDREKEGDNENYVTPVGKILRKTRIDELPQLWSILKGDLSLIGPRPDMEGLASGLESAIAYYQLRYAVTPGLSGWAQINQHEQPQSIHETRERLAYDLYYIKYRSIALDIYIGLKTIKTLLSREGK